MQRNKITKQIITHLERMLIKRCSFSIMVNDSIADEVQRIHGLKERPVVVRSIPEKWDVDYEICRQEREKLISQMGSKVDALISTHGYITEDRGIEQLIEAVSIKKDLGLLILGNGSRTYIESLKNKAESLNCMDRIVFHPAVQQREIWRYVGAADVSMVMIQPTSASYIMALPNKFFESIQSEIPVIVSELPELKRQVDKYEIGFYCSPSNATAIVGCIDKLLGNHELYLKIKNNILLAKNELCWENEKKKLEDAYRSLLQ